jgi:methylase of polypeptide subunit release factors
MRGFVPTPDAVVDRMVEKLFAGRSPRADEVLLDPGCGPGAFISGLIRWAERQSCGLPEIVGYENEPARYAEARKRFGHLPNVKIVRGDFLAASGGPFDYIIGNPPYVSITYLPTREREEFRRRFFSAEGRFDLYLLFFEKALRLLNLKGRLVFITPEKFLYVNTARSLRRILGNYYVREIEFISEETFGDLVTYPTITTVDSVRNADAKTKIQLRDGSRRTVVFPKDGSSLQPVVNDYRSPGHSNEIALKDVCVRISCGVATGADAVFVHKTGNLKPDLAYYSYPTISGRDLSSGRPIIRSNSSMLIPYDAGGKLLAMDKLGALGVYLSEPNIRRKLEGRTCAQRKPWYAFHDSVPLADILRPKLICKDITAKPHFWIDREGGFIPRHSAYYLVPIDSSKIESLCEFLNGPIAADWLQAHCQRASKGFLRLQSSVLKRLPVPAEFAPTKTKANLPTDEVRLAASAAAA